MTLARGDWSVRVEAEASLSATATDFDLKVRLDAFEGDTCVVTRLWNRRIPRDGA
jgi:hypothetical protein